MAQIQDLDVMRSAAHQHMIAHLTAPFAAGAVDSIITISDEGKARTTRNTREPLLAVTLLNSLDRKGLKLSGTLDPDGVATPLVPSLMFSPYSEAGACLPLYRPGVDPSTRTALPFVIQLALSEITEDGVERPIPPTEIHVHVEVRVIEGNLGRLIFLLGSEKPKIRRQAREIAAMRFLTNAHSDALDRFGAELGVPRFTDILDVQRDQKGKLEIVTRHFDAAGKPIVEADEEYRRRLKLYRPFASATRSRLSEVLNGAGVQTDPNRGPLAELGLQSRFAIREEDNEFGVSIHLVSAGGDHFRTNFLEHIRRSRLIWPNDVQAANDVHRARFLSSNHKDEVNTLRNSLRESFKFADNAAIAPMLVDALERVARCRRALGDNSPWRVLRTQDSTGGSRYELGTGIDLEILSAKKLGQLIAALEDPARQPATDLAGHIDMEVEELLKSMTPRPAAEDPEAAWLLKPCGLQTIHRLNDTHMYVSHLPTFGMKITAASTTNPGVKMDLEAQYHAARDPGGNIVLLDALKEVTARWVAGGAQAFTVLSEADAVNRLSHAVLPPGAATTVLQKANLHVMTNPVAVTTQLKRLPPELVRTFQLAVPQALKILAGDQEAVQDLVRLARLLEEQGVSAALPLITDSNEVVFVVGVIGLPEVGTNLSIRRSTGFRWYAVPIVGKAGEIKAVGSRSYFIPSEPGLCAIVALGYARRGLTDPYEFRVELPSEGLLNVGQYEFLMNALEHLYPLGVEVNTFSIRKHHVDLNGDGIADPLPPTVSHTYRRFRRRRYRGETGVVL